MTSLTARYPIWRLRDPAPPEYLIALQGLHPVVAQILFNRKLTEPTRAQEFIAGRVDNDDPFHLYDMDRAVSRLVRAIADREYIAVYGDYDVDGVTATALLVEILASLGAKVGNYIPSRFDEGYGLNREALAYLREKGASLVVTVDCGARGSGEVDYANEIGLEVIVTDHHELGHSLPPALAVINPKRAECQYPNDELAGVGLAYKLAQALLTEYGPAARRRGYQPRPLENLLDLVALGTVADVAPLYGENRALVRQGLTAIHNTIRPGLRALVEVAGLRLAEIQASQIGFQLGPRLNAAGRMEHAKTSYQLLRTKDPVEARTLAGQLNEQNRDRQQQTKAMQHIARECILAEGGPGWFVLVADPAFHPGLVGLVASRLSEEFHRPAAVVALDPASGFSRGSARSIEGFDVTAALDECAELLVRYGGHAAAAGFTVENRLLPALAARLQQVTAERLGHQTPQPALDIDARLPLRALDRNLTAVLRELEPCGAGNRAPLFASTRLRIVDHRPVGSEHKHIRLTVTDGREERQAIVWSGASWVRISSAPVDMAYSLEPNGYNAPAGVQMVVKDIRPSPEPNRT